MSRHVVTINRAPVLTLWAAVVAERLGFRREEALTLGKCVAGLNARSKGRRLGIFKPGVDKGRTPRGTKRGEEFRVDLCGRAVPAIETAGGIRAVKGDREISAESVATYLEKKVGADLDDTRAAMEELARSYDPAELADAAYALYEEFRPAIPPGRRGWGAKGELDLDRVRELRPDA